MKIIFVTNYAINHQTGLWDEFCNTDKKVDFTYLATAHYDETRKAMRYQEETRPYIKNSLDLSENQLEKLFENVDIVIFAQSEDLRLFKYFEKVKNVITIQEHVLKKKTLKKYLAIFNQTRKNKKYFPSAKRFALAPSYYSYKELKISHFTKKQNIFKFGYFPKLDIECFEKSKQIIWSGRMLDWKHPEHAIYASKIINNLDSEYKLVVYGNGPLKDSISKNTPSYVSIHDFILNKDLLNNFKKSEIGLFTSDRGEGWGVVLNEMLSSGCVVFANRKAGSTRFLIKDGFNGFTYKTKKELKEKIIKYFSQSENNKKQLSSNAMNTISEIWNNKVAAKRLFELCESIIENKPFNKYNEGPLSGF